jgi:hypothetical protein
MNRTIKDANAKRFYCDGYDQLRTYLSDFMAAYNFDCGLKQLSGLNLYEYIEDLDVRAGKVNRQPDPPNGRTKHLDAVA